MTKVWPILLVFVAVMLGAADSVWAQDGEVPWYEPVAEVDVAAKEPQPPVPPAARPPKYAFALEMGPIGYLGSEPVSGLGTFLKARQAVQQKLGLFFGLLLPGGVLAGGAEINPLGGKILLAVHEDVLLWLLGPRLSLLGLLGTNSGGFGVGAQLAPVGARVTKCIPTCVFADVRVLEFSGLLYAGDPDIGFSFLKSLGGNLAAGVAF